MVKKRLLLILKFLISFGLIALLMWIMRKDTPEIIKIFKESNKFLIACAIVINIPLSIALSYRLRLLLSGQGIRISIKDAVYLTFIGYFYNNFLPTAIGGDIAKAYYASKKTNNKVASYSAVLADRILGLISTLIIALIGLLFICKSVNNKFVLWTVPILFLFTISFVFFLLRKNKQGPVNDKLEGKGALFALKSKILKLYNGLNLYRNKPALLIKALFLSFGLQFLSIVNTYIFVLSIGGTIAIFRMFLIIPLVWTVSMLPLSMNGLGVREWAFKYFLQGYIGPEKAVSVSILWLGLIMLYSLIGGVVHLFYRVEFKDIEAEKELL